MIPLCHKAAMNKSLLGSRQVFVFRARASVQP
jgi:hypothetical protein